MGAAWQITGDGAHQMQLQMDYWKINEMTASAYFLEK